MTDDLILYIKNPKDATKNMLELTNKSSEVVGGAVNTQNSVVRPCTNTELSEKELTISLSFSVISQWTQC